MLSLDQALEYVAALAGSPQAAVTLQAFDDGAKRDPSLAAVRGGSVQSLWAWVRLVQAQGCGVFCTVNATEAGKRKASDVGAVRALFCDFDTPRTRDWHLPPSIVVQSAHGEHAYWLTEDCPLDQFRAAQQRLALHYGSDPRIVDLPRVMRLPGTAHLKARAIPVRLVHAVRLVRSTADILGGIAELPQRHRQPERERRHEAGGVCDTRTFDALRYFEDNGAVLGHDPAHAGKHFVVCPWANLHTGGRQGRTDTLLFTDGERPQLWCAHASCDGKGLRELRAELDAGTLARYCDSRQPFALTRSLAQANRYEAP